MFVLYEIIFELIMNLILAKHKLNIISKTVACTTLYVATAQQRESLRS